MFLCKKSHSLSSIWGTRKRVKKASSSESHGVVCTLTHCHFWTLLSACWGISSLTLEISIPIWLWAAVTPKFRTILSYLIVLQQQSLHSQIIVMVRDQSQMIIVVIMIRMNVCTTFHGNPPNSWWKYLTKKNKNVNLMAVLLKNVWDHQNQKDEKWKISVWWTDQQTEQHPQSCAARVAKSS